MMLLDIIFGFWGFLFIYNDKFIKYMFKIVILIKKMDFIRLSICSMIFMFNLVIKCMRVCEFVIKN